MEDDLWLKKTFDGRRPLMEDNLWWKTPFDGRPSSMEDDYEDNLKNKEDLHIAGRHRWSILIVISNYTIKIDKIYKQNFFSQYREVLFWNGRTCQIIIV